MVESISRGEVSTAETAPQMYEPLDQYNGVIPWMAGKWSICSWIGLLLLIVCYFGILLPSLDVSYYEEWNTSIENGVKTEWWEKQNIDDLEDMWDSDESSVEDILYKTPATVFIIGIIVGIFLIFFDLSANADFVKNIASVVLLSCTSLCGFFLLISGMTWLGNYSGFIGNPDVRITVMPFYFICGGTLLLVMPLGEIKRQLSMFTEGAINDPTTLCNGLFKIANRSLFASALCLILLPLAPVYATDYGDEGQEQGQGIEYITPFDVELYYQISMTQGYYGFDYNAPDHQLLLLDTWSGLHDSITVTWFIFWSSLCFLGISIFTSRSTEMGKLAANLSQAHGLLIIPICIGIYNVISMYISISKMDVHPTVDYTISVNFFLPILFAYLLVKWISHQLPYAILPWLRDIRLEREKRLLQEKLALQKLQNSAYWNQHQHVPQFHQQIPQIQYQQMPQIQPSSADRLPPPAPPPHVSGDVSQNLNQE